MTDFTNPSGSKGLSVNLIPNFFKTDANKRFLQATVDQLVAPGTVKKVNGFVGRQYSKSTTGTDLFVEAPTLSRQNYQLEPSLTVQDTLGNTTFFKDYIDYINQLSVFGADVSNHARLNKQEFYSWNPHIDWDKFVNFQNYYWLSYGPDTIKIFGQQLTAQSTYKIALEYQGQNNQYVFTPDGLTPNPSIKLYRGQTYKFIISSPSNPISIKTVRSLGIADRYQIPGIDAYGVETGVITVTIPANSPNVLYYQSETDINLGGVFEIYNIDENSFINIGTEILGKVNYTLSDGTKLSNGMKVSFGGQVTPVEYATGEYYVEGVGTAIQLIEKSILEISTTYTESETLLFDAKPFDTDAFSDSTGFANTLDYMIINRASRDHNPWSRYNRWFHKDVINASAAFNKTIASLDQSLRAVRPIIEFNADLKLFNFGTDAIFDIDLVDDFTKDAFSIIEGKLGYDIDNINLSEGQKILFLADTDRLVKNKIFKVEFINVTPQELNQGTRRQIHLVELHSPTVNEVVLVKQGKSNQGIMYWFDGTTWTPTQQKTNTNQFPLFDVVDSDGVSFGNINKYDGTTFKGTRIFSYKVNPTGTIDTKLGFALSYRNIENIGDIVFDFNFDTDVFSYRKTVDIINAPINIGYLVTKDYAGNTVYKNAWEICATGSHARSAIRIYKNSNQKNNFKLDIFDDVTKLTDLIVHVYINSNRIASDHWTLVDGPDYKIVKLKADILETDVLTLKAHASQPINSNGFYEIPLNLQNNPLNSSLTTLTLGEVIDHVNSIVDGIYVRDADAIEEINFDTKTDFTKTLTFVGVFPGASNLRDLGNITPYGTKFVQHSSPASISLYHVTTETNNVIRAIQESRDKYIQFKKNFLAVASNLGIETTPSKQVDLILEQINKDKSKTDPYYFSDMVPYRAGVKTTVTVVDPRVKTYPLKTTFTLATLSNKAVIVYVNDLQLIYQTDYYFSEQGFIVINYTLAENDIVSITEYDSTDGSFIPETPTKLGMWPKYKPMLYLDTTLVTPRWMIQGHDGSHVLAYGTYGTNGTADYRDAIILELEKRIFNNIKVEYNTEIFDIAELLPSYNRPGDYSRKEFNQVLAPSFYQWSALVDRDFTKPLSFDRNNPFTFKYNSFSTPDGQEAPGYWRGIYQWIYDTDRPHLCPWEMLGFSIEPSWWQTLYGPAPYTRDNLVMWKDISEGFVRNPAVPAVQVKKYIKPFLLNHLPVDSAGKLVNPLVSGFIKGTITAHSQTDFVFGDGSPVETAWKRSSHYAFSVILTALLLKPSDTFGKLLDRSRITRNLCGQLVYTETGLRIKSKDIKLPSIYSSTDRVQTSGIINYIINYILSDNLKSYNTYTYDLTYLNTKLSYRVGAFTAKEKFKLLLDSKSPLSTSSVFVPPEDYTVILNSSSPIKKLTYSGVIVSKLADGYEIKGYSRSTPYFKYYQYQQSGITINIGGISENFVTWTANEQFGLGQVVKYNNQYFRSIVTHTASNTFNKSYYEALPRLPIIGGRDAVIRKSWDKSIINTSPYGTKFEKIQEVVDFLLGYGEWLKDEGFIFDEFNPILKAVTNWETSAKEFLFWTTQNWSTGQEKWAEWTSGMRITFGDIVRYNGDYFKANNNSTSSVFLETDFTKLDGLSSTGGSAISLSPAAAKLTFKTELSVIDDIRNPFNGYEIFKVDGTPLEPTFINSYREDNAVSYSPRSDDGIYGATFYLIQQEHVVLLNNTTIFNDTIFKPETGYKQERIKVSGYVSTNWYGGLDIPGFILDVAKIQNWTPWEDYDLGDIVKYKQFYYTASRFLPGAVAFVNEDWILLDKKPVTQLLPNWTYKAEQFTDFYSLDSDNFDTAQQRLAQHLIGYQKRQYLTNIIKDDVSEFKFYQGMIREKGTQNSLNKLFDVKSALGEESLTFFEEWAIRTGQYGASESFETIEFVLDESKIRDNPQGFILEGFSYDNQIRYSAEQKTDFTIILDSNQVYLKPVGYDARPWPLLKKSQPYLRSAGYFRSDDVYITVKSMDDLLKIDPATFQPNVFVAVTFESTDWNVYKYVDSDVTVTNVDYSSSAKTLTITLSELVEFAVGSYVGIDQVNLIKGFYKVVSVSLNTFTVSATITNWAPPFTQSQNVIIFKFISQRASTMDLVDNLTRPVPAPGDKLWIDSNSNDQYQDNNWSVWEYSPIYNRKIIPNSAPIDGGNYGKTISCTKLGNIIAIGSNSGDVEIWDKSGYISSWIQRQTIAKSFVGFNNSVAVTAPATVVSLSFDGKWLATGSPLASNAYTKLKGNFNTSTAYVTDDIVYVADRGAYSGFYQALQNNTNSTISRPDGVAGLIPNVAFWKKIKYVPTVLSGTSSGLSEQGIVSLYSKDANNIFTLVDTIVSPFPAGGSPARISYIIPANGSMSLGGNIKVSFGNVEIVSTFTSTYNTPVKVAEQLVILLNSNITFSNSYVAANTNTEIVISSRSLAINLNTLKQQITTVVTPRILATLSNVAISGTTGEFTCDTASLKVGQTVEIRGNFSAQGAGSISYKEQTTAKQLAIAVTATSATSPSYSLTCTSTATLSVGMPIVFNNTLGGTNAGGIIEGTTYYVNAILSGTTFNISATSGGAIFITSLVTGITTLTVEPTFITYNNQTQPSDFYIYSTNGSTTFKLVNYNEYTRSLYQAIGELTTTAGNTTGLTFLLYESPAVLEFGNSSTDTVPGEKFGSQLAFANDKLYISAIGYNNSAGRVYKLAYSTNVQATSYYNPVGSSGTTLKITSTLGILPGMLITGVGFTSGQTVLDVLPSAVGTLVNSSITLSTSDTFVINGTTITGVTTLTALITAINANTTIVSTGVNAVNIKETLNLFSTNVSLAISGTAVTKVGLTEKTYVANNTLEISQPPDTTPTGLIEFSNVGWGFDLSATLFGDVADQHFGSGLATDDDSTLVVTANNNLLPGQVKIYRSGALFQTITGTGLNFGKSVDISDNADYLVISDSLADNEKQDSGEVTVYQFQGSAFTAFQKLKNHKPKNSGYFGSKVAFIDNYSTLIVYSANQDTVLKTTFDQYTIPLYDIKSVPEIPAGNFDYVNNIQYKIKSLGNTDWNIVAGTIGVKYKVGDIFIASTAGFGTGTACLPELLWINNSTSDTDTPTTFDKDSTNISQLAAESGRIDVYVRYNTKWIYQDTLKNLQTSGSGFGQAIATGFNHILVTAPFEYDQNVQSGIVIDYETRAGAFYSSWVPIHMQTNIPDPYKVKSAFLYNKATGELVKYIDVIDLAQGKIAGPAREEIKYSCYYDPATYSVSVATDNVTVDKDAPWGKEQVGYVWWDLRTTKVINAYDDSPIYRNSHWNTLAVGASVDLYEWVESTLLPAAWDAQADTEAGIANSISGKSLYGNNVYSIKERFDTGTNTKKYTYYYWVKNKKTIPNTAGRNLSAIDVATLIANPRGSAYTYLALTGFNSFSLVNAAEYLQDSNIVLSVEYWTVDNPSQNIHSQWKIINNDSSTVIPAHLEQKWFDSLCGKDAMGRDVPDLTLAEKLRYGVENRPRQGMFINRFEALKQLVEEANAVLLKNPVVDSRNISNINVKDPAPNLVLGLYDTTQDTSAELRFVNVGAFRRPVLSGCTIVDGKITDINISYAGRGYLVAPYISISGSGEGAVVKAILSSNGTGQIIGATVINPGEGYDNNTVATIRDYSVLITNDADARGVWSVYSYDPIGKVWSRTKSQSYDVTAYWNKTDWYAAGYSQFTAIDHAVDMVSDLQTLNDSVGQIIKVRTTTAGWSLLEKISNVESFDYTQMYKVVGLENGTIQLNPALYTSSTVSTGYDGTTYDGISFDNSPNLELRIILESLKNDIFIDDLKINYLNLFFTTVRYALSEQVYLDWIFKTSFIKARHNVGQLSTPVTYNNDNLSNFQDYIDEVKPFKSKIREYVSSYQSVDSTPTMVSDFDLPPIYRNNTITTITTNTNSGVITADDAIIRQYPWKNWLDNVGFIVTNIKIINGGSGYITEPVVKIINDSGSGATARAFFTNGVINRIILLTYGSGYLSAPQVQIIGGLSSTGVAARAVAIIGNSVSASKHHGVVRSSLIKIKFDRITSSYFFVNLEETEFITTTGNLQYKLTYAPDVTIGLSTVTINDVPVLRENYKLTTVETKTDYTTYSGLLTFDPGTQPAKGQQIKIVYLKNQSLLNAADRIRHYYKPQDGDIGNDLSQLMTGVDYGGVIIQGLGFEVSAGWGTTPWFTDKWDSFDPLFDDYILTVAANTRSFTLPYTPLAGTKINTYYVGLNLTTIPVVTDILTYSYTYIGTNPIATLTRNVLAGGTSTNYIPEEPYNPTSVIVKVASVAGITAGMYVVGTGFTSSQRVSLTNSTTNTVTLSSAPNVRPNGTLYFTKSIAGSAILSLSSTVGLRVGDTVSTSSASSFGPDTVIKTILNSTEVLLNQIIYVTVPTASTIVFTREMNRYTDIVISNGFVNLTTSLTSGSVINITSTLPSIKLDDENFGTPQQTNANAVIPTFIGNGNSNVITIPNTFVVSAGDKFILRKSTSDGSIIPQDTDYDSLVTGGDINYTTASGLNADDILIDGDGFVTPTSSPAPEEVVPGQVVDAVAIKVYDQPNAGSANIKVDNFIGNSLTRIFKMSQTPNNAESIIVKKSNVILNSDQYTVDYRNREVTLLVAPTTGEVVSIYNIGFNGNNILDIDYFVGDGITTEFITKAPWLSAVTNIVYVDGVVATPVLFKTDASYETANRVALRFGTAPTVNALINYVIVSGNQQTFAITKKERIVTTGANTYVLAFPVGNNLPAEANMIVRVNQNILSSPVSSYFTIKNNKLSYNVDITKIIPYSAPITNILVIVGTTVLKLGTDYTVDPGGITIKINKITYATYVNKTLVITVNSSQGYVYNPTNNTIVFSQTYTTSDIVEVISSYNHDILDIQRTAITISTNLSITQNSAEYYTYKEALSGLIALDRTVISDEYVWVVKNNTLLTPSVDYKLNDNKQSIQLASKPAVSDVFTLITFGNNVLGSTISYMQFKDMLNRVHYKRLSKNKQTHLLQPLAFNDTSIVVEDASNFDAPNAAINRPGIIEIRGERIEYFGLVGNTLSKLRRGTLGTGVPLRHTAGTLVQDIGPSETLPYTESSVIQQVESDGSNIINLNFVPTKLSVEKWFTNFGFTLLGNHSISKNYTANDVVVYNNLYYVNIKSYMFTPTITILPTNATYWKLYDTTIPVGYGQCDEIEVFIGGYNIDTVWATGTAYAVGTIVISGSYTYQAAVAHTSKTTFKQDYNLGYWKLFVGNTRLKKTPYKVHHELQSSNSSLNPSNFDQLMNAEFAVDGVSAAVRLTTPVDVGVKVTVVKRMGTDWDSKLNIQYDSGAITEFLKATPGIWYSDNISAGVSP